MIPIIDSLRCRIRSEIHPPAPGWFSSTDADELDRRCPRIGLARLGAPGLRAKRWWFAAVAAPSAFCGVMLIDAGYAAQASIWVFDRKRHELRDRTWMSVPGFGVRVPEGGVRGEAVFRAPRADATIRAHGFAFPREVQARGSIDATSVEMFVSAQPGAEVPAPVQYAERTDAGWQFTHKVMGVPAEGFARIGARRLPLTGGDLLADYSIGLMPRRVAWFWAAGAGRAADGRRLAFNFVSGFNDAGGGENTVWIDGVPGRAGPVAFSTDSHDLLQPWSIRSSDGSTDLVFRPEGMRRQDMNLGLVRTKYRLPFGTFRGHIRVGDRSVSLAEAAGVTERHESTW